MSKTCKFYYQDSNIYRFTKNHSIEKLLCGTELQSQSNHLE